MKIFKKVIALHINDLAISLTVLVTLIMNRNFNGYIMVDKRNVMLKIEIK